MTKVEVGMKFGYLEVIKLHRKDSRSASWLCRCVCGTERVYSTSKITGGGMYGGRYKPVKSCGCKKNARGGAVIENKRLYNTWYYMNNRCYDSSADNYERYGGAGVTVCDEWREDFNTFVEWANANGYKDGLTIDRIDPDKPYSPDNCRWADYYTQAQNRGMLKANKTGVIGVSFNTRFNKYTASIRRNDLRKYLGSYDTLEEASDARKKAEEYFEAHGTLVGYKPK